MTSIKYDIRYEPHTWFVGEQRRTTDAVQTYISTVYENTWELYGRTRGSSKSHAGTEYFIRQLAKAYGSDSTPNKNRTTFSSKVRVESAKLPDSYPVGDLGTLLGVEL